MKTKILACSFVILFAAATLATAGNAVDWTGWYGGAFGGYLSGELNSEDDDDPTTPSHEESTGNYDDDGPMAGLYGGYHRQYDSGWVSGVEVILPLYMQKGTAEDIYYFTAPGQTVTYEGIPKWGGFAGAKLGRAYDKMLPYAILAVGFTSAEGKTIGVDEAENYVEGYEQSATATHFAWQLGIGLDYQVDETLFAGIRLMLFEVTKSDYTMPWNEPGPNDFGYSALLVQINGGYRF